MGSEGAFSRTAGPAGGSGRIGCIPQNSEFSLGGGGRGREQRAAGRTGNCTAQGAMHLPEGDPPLRGERALPLRRPSLRPSRACGVL